MGRKVPAVLLSGDHAKIQAWRRKESLEKMLLSYEGTVLFVSHDRYFINRIATGILNIGDETGKTDRKTADAAKDKDIPDQQRKNTPVNPGRERARIERKIEKYNRELQCSEELADSLKVQMSDPLLSADYEKLMELHSQLEEQEKLQEEILMNILEAEGELEKNF